MWNPFKRTVDVEMIESGSGRVMARSAVPLQQLPETFAVPTTMHLPDGDWDVVRSEPLTKAQFTRSRRLQLWLSRVQPVTKPGPGDIRFSLPTICDALPASTGKDADGSELTLHEDDWRQREWVARAHSALIEQELGAIRAVHAESASQGGMGFTRIHVRSAIEHPLSSLEVRLSALIAGLNAKPLAVQGVRFRDSARCIVDGFAIPLPDGGWAYGTARHDVVTVLALADEATPEPITLAPMGRAADWVFVDWCRSERV